jgi:hypothetical protein
MIRLDDLESKKQLLIAQAEFDRLKFAMAMHDVRRIVRPPVEPSRRTAAHSTASRVLGFVLPVLGASRLGRVVRGLSIALSIYRFLRGFRSRP